MLRSISSDVLNMLWCHGRSYSDTERSLNRIKTCSVRTCTVVYGHQSSTDSVIGESECITSPLQQSDPVAYTNRYNSTDSAISSHLVKLTTLVWTLMSLTVPSTQALLTCICPVVLVSIMRRGNEYSNTGNPASTTFL